MDYNSVFDIIGPIMVGPSSSHTAGAARIGKAVHTLFGRTPDQAEILFFGSFAQTYKGHGSDVAVIGGLLGMNPDDSRIREAYRLADEAGLKISLGTSDKPTAYPNTLLIRALGENMPPLYVMAASLGGGKIRVVEINGFQTALSCDNPTLLVFHQDKFGTIAHVTQAIAARRINIGHMEVSRNHRGEEALMLIEVDGKPDESLVAHLEGIDHVSKVKIV